MSSSRFPDSVFTEVSRSTQLRSLLFDGVTGLPTVPVVLESLKDLAAEQHRLGILFVDATKLEAMEETHGWEMVDRLIHQIRVFLDSIATRFSPLRMTMAERISGDSIVLFFHTQDPHQPVTAERMSQISDQLQTELNEYVGGQLGKPIAPFARLYNGYSVLQFTSNVRFERLLSRAINQAFYMAVSQEERVRQVQIQQLQEIMSSSQIRIFFQPIYKLDGLTDVLGYEALSRGPAGSLFESAEFMFTLASDTGMLNRLENLCQTRLISTLQKQPEAPMVFINLEPSFLENDRYQQLALFNDPGVKPSHVVLEITERVAINDYDLVSRSLESIRKSGYRIAVDDVGSGYASLQSIACLKPDYIKVNEKMVNGIADDFIKQEIVKTLRDLASRFSASLIAEGIEKQEDLQTLQDLQVPFGQGYLLKRPGELL